MCLLLSNFPQLRQIPVKLTELQYANDFCLFPVLAPPGQLQILQDKPNAVKHLNSEGFVGIHLNSGAVFILLLLNAMEYIFNFATMCGLFQALVPPGQPWKGDKH